MHDTTPTGTRDGNATNGSAIASMQDGEITARVRVEAGELVITAYRPEEVASRLNISRRHVYNLINGGKLRKVTLGGRWMVLAEELDQFIERLKGGEAA